MASSAVARSFVRGNQRGCAHYSHAYLSSAGGLQQNHRLRLNLSRACCTAAQARNTEALIGVFPLFNDTDGADANSNARFEITRVKADG
ncbi:hypothetical protein VDF90_03005 [Xanthomonas campestris pv. raphani]|uniref:hypothetical protein n=1 Tax=Xanthomonas campestris TaxID=339 RepID=UPI002B236F9C|nr:hypothetical protein [Xanthomonas campestris]MEA9786238.1 hypothetical protein [Xanthomonas campestris pv. raphani]